MSRTNFFTCPTVRTLFVINMSTEIIHLDRLTRTSLLAFFTSDTPYFTVGSHSLALRIGTAMYKHLLRIWNQLNQMFRTFRNTFTTGFACLFIYDSDSIYNMNGIKWAAGRII